jgi:hypothetical protein
MGLTETFVFYLFIGLAVAVAMFLQEDRRTLAYTSFLCVSAVLFWPLYLPLLLSARSARAAHSESPGAAAPDEMARAIAQLELELDAALSSLDGWAEDALAGEKSRIAELRHALAAQATRIRDLDELLARIAASRLDELPKAMVDQTPADEALDRCQRSQQALAQNVARLGQIRRQAHADLMATLAWIRELVSMIHLAKFTGAPASRAEELVGQIAAAVEGISAVTWQETESHPTVPNPPLADQSPPRQREPLAFAQH